MDLKIAYEKFLEADSDVLLYAGPIDRAGYHTLCQVLDAREVNRKRVLLILCTHGGDPNAGYRIARALTHAYGSENFRVAVPAECKSAGTLVCIGAHSLVICDKGELGPLDVQFQKSDEIFQQSSGLDILRGMTYLKDDALSAFKQYLFDINGGSGLSTKVASEIASNLVKGIYEPMYAQIDPIRLGEMNAALQIAYEYGTRLDRKSKSLKAGALMKLIHHYPTHGFVIDRAEARDLFERVSHPSEAEHFLAVFMSSLWWGDGRNTRAKVTDCMKSIKSFFAQEPEHEPTPNEPDSATTADSARGSLDSPRATGTSSPGDGGEQPFGGCPSDDGAAAEGAYAA